VIYIDSQAGLENLYVRFESKPAVYEAFRIPFLHTNHDPVN